MQSHLSLSRIALKTVVLLSALMIGTLPALARDKYETIDATAFGTGDQMGQNIGVTLMIYEFSTPADRAVLAAAFQKGQNQGLVNALQKMRTVGRVEFTGTLGNDCAYMGSRRPQPGAGSFSSPIARSALRKPGPTAKPCRMT